MTAESLVTRPVAADMAAATEEAVTAVEAHVPEEAVEVEVAAPVQAAPVVQPRVEAAAAAELAQQVVAAPQLTPEEQRRHDEARRFARLLVSEIRLYNEQAVQDGKANRDIYQRLKDDIDRSREMYEQRVPQEIRAASNYFFEELVRTLADGDPDALGL